MPWTHTRIELEADVFFYHRLFKLDMFWRSDFSFDTLNKNMTLPSKVKTDLWKTQMFYYKHWHIAIIRPSPFLSKPV